jgi:hypothetical protein
MISILKNLSQPQAGLIDWAQSLQDRAFGHLAKAITEFRSAKPFWD